MTNHEKRFVPASRMVELRVFSVAVRRHRMLTKAIVQLNDERFWAGLTRLSGEYDISGADLVGFMSNSVTARLDDEHFWSSLARLSDECDISGASLARFMNNDIAIMLGDGTFWTALA